MTNHSLEHLSFFADISPTHLEKISDKARWKQVNKGQLVVSNANVTSEVIIAVEGSLRVQLYAPNGRLLILRDVQPGEWVGEISVLKNAPRAVNIVAITDGRIASFTQSDFLDIMREHPILLERLARRLVERIYTLHAQIFEMAALNVSGRIQTYLWRQALKGRRTDNGILIEPAPTHEMIANQVGTHREAVTRMLNQLARQGVLEKRRGVIKILEEEQLAQSVDQLVGWRVPRYGESGFGL